MEEDEGEGEGIKGWDIIKRIQTWNNRKKRGGKRRKKNKNDNKNGTKKRKEKL